ncbi:MAG: ABC-type transport auxiliary lipoprotein family protein [Desulfobacteraceae bacterium]|nr:ABC-type transport auxiliary lipoprotein family protein [Desulfobacteraceae bacterium]
MIRHLYLRITVIVVLAALIGALSACSLIGRREPLKIYVLPAAALPAADLDPLPLTLRIDTPQANRALYGSRIVVMPTTHQLSAYQGARWGDNAPSLLRDRLVEAFRQNGRLAAVVDAGDRVSADFDLVSDLGAFQSEYVQGKPQAVIRLDVRLIDSGRQRVLAARRFEVRETSANESVDAVVEAFGRAADDLSRQLVDWTLERIAGN